MRVSGIRRGYHDAVFSGNMFQMSAFSLLITANEAFRWKLLGSFIVLDRKPAPGSSGFSIWVCSWTNLLARRWVSSNDV
jgi:hypothetical protein